MSDVASLSVGLDLNAAQFKSKLLDSFRHAEKQTRQYTKVAKEEAKKTSEAFALINKELGFSLKNMMVLAGAGFSFSAIISTTRKYSQALSDLSSITGVAGKQLDLLDQKALKMSRNSQFSAIQVVEAYKNIASAKPELLSVSGGLDGVTQSSITLAQAAGSTLPDAAKTLTLSLSQFGVGASEADRFINVLAAGAKFGASEINDTALAIKNSGVAASQANLSFESLNAAIQILAEREVKGGEAGTALRNIILKLEKSTDSSLKPSVVGLENALDNLSKKNLSTAQAVKLFGLENINAASILMQSKSKLSTLTDQLTGTNTAYEQSSIRINNLNGDLDSLANSFEGLVIKMGQSGTGPLRSGVQSVSGAVNYLADNFNQVSSIALHTLVPIMGVKLTAGLRASTAEWYNQEMAMRKAAITQTQTAKTTLANAQATIAESQAQARSLASHQALLKQHGLNVSYQKEYAVLYRTIKEAKISEALATEKLAAANSQLAIKSRMAATAGKMLRGAYSLIGGPLGAAMLAGSALFYFSDRAKEAKENAMSLSEQLADLKDKLQSMSDISLVVKKNELTDKIANAKEQLKQNAIDIKSVEDNNSGFFSSSRSDELRKKKDKLLEEKEILSKGVDDGEQQLDDINSLLSARVGPQKPIAIKNTPKEEDTPNGSIWNGIDAKATVGKYKDVLTELEISNASSLDKINLQEQQAKDKLTKSAKESGISNEQLQKDLFLVTEKYAKERQQIVEKYSPASAVVRQAKETNKELESLYNAGLISKEMYQAKLVEPSNEIRASVDPNFKAQQEFELKIASLNEYLLQEKALLDEARVQNELSEESYQDRLLDLQKKYGSLKLKAEIDNTNRMQQTTSAVFTASRDLFGGMADLVGAFTNESGAAYKTLFAISKGFAIADAVLKLNSAIMQVMADPTATTPAQKFANYAAIASAGGQVLSTIQSATLTGMSHDGINYVPKEGTWLLDKGERVLSSSENKDLTKFLDNGSPSNKSSNNITVNVPVNIGDNTSSESDVKQFAAGVKAVVKKYIDDQVRVGGTLNRR